MAAEEQTLARPAGEVEVKWPPIEIPNFASVQLIGTINLEKKSYSLAGVLEKKIEAGPLSADKWTVKISNTKGLSITTEVGVFNEKATVGLKEFKTTKKATFGIDLANPVVIYITPWKTISIQTIDLIVEKGKAPILAVPIDIFTQKSLLKFAGSKKDNFLSFSFKTLSLDALLAEAPDKPTTDLDKKVILKDLEFEIRNFFKQKKVTNGKKPKEQPLRGTIKGTINLSQIVMKEINQDVSNLKMKAVIDAASGITFDVQLDDLEISPLKVSHAQFLIVANPKKTVPPKDRLLLILSGDTKFNIPNFGEFDLKLLARYQEGVFSLKAKVGKEITFQGATLRDVMVALAPQRNEFELAGNTTIHGLKVKGLIKITKPKDTYETSFSGEAISKTPYKPFAKSGIAGIETIAISAVKVTLETGKEKAGFLLSGKAKIMDVPVNATVGLLKVGEQKGLMLKALLPTGWKLPKPLDDLTISSPGFLISTLEYQDDELGLKVRKGIGVTAGLKVAGPLNKVTSLTGKLKQDEVRMYAVIGTELKDMVVSAAMPATIDFKNPRIKGGKLVLEITGERTLSLITSLLLKPTDKDPELRFTARIRLEELEAVLAGTMEGMWKDPLGIKGLEIGNVALEAGFTYAAGIPTSFGFIGEMVLSADASPNKIKLGGKIGADPRKIAVIGAIQTLSLKEVVYLAGKMVAKAKIKGLSGPEFQKGLNNLPPMGFKNVELKFAPYGAKIGELRIERGLTIKGDVEVVNKTGSIHLNVDDSGILARGYMSEFTLGPLKVTGPGPDFTKGSGDDGPIMDLLLKFVDQHLFIGATVSIFDVQAHTDIRMSKDKISFKTSAKIYDVFRAEIEAESRGDIRNPDFYLKAQVKDDLGSFLYKHVKKHLDKIKNGKELRQKIDNINRDLAALNSLKTKIGQLGKKIYDEEQRYESLKAGPKVVQGTKSLGDRGGWRTQQAGLITERAAKKTALEAARTALIVFIKSKQWAGNAAEFIVKGNIISVKQATIEASLRGLSTGKLPRLKADLVFIGLPLKIDVNMNVKDLPRAGDHIAREIIQKFNAMQR